MQRRFRRAVFRLLSGPLGGDQQIGSRIAESKIDVLIFFWDSLGRQSYDSDVKALLRLATAFNIPNACDEATADCIISSLLLDPEPKAVAVLDAFALAIIAGGSTRVYPGVAGYEPDLMLARNDAKKNQGVDG